MYDYFVKHSKINKTLVALEKQKQINKTEYERVLMYNVDGATTRGEDHARTRRLRDDFWTHG